MNSRKDLKGRVLKEGENYRSDGRYIYRYTDKRSGKRITVYAADLPQLREKEKQIAKDLEDSILTDGAAKKLTLNGLFKRYIDTRELKESTKANYTKMWENRVGGELGNIKVVQMLPSHIKGFYAQLSKAGYSHSTIKFLHNMIYPAFEMAVDDDIIRKNPAKKALGDYGKEAEAKTILTVNQQERFLAFVKDSNVYNVYYNMLIIMLQTAVRCGELIGLTWSDVDMENKTVNINHQLVYKNYGDGCKFHVTTPKTESGNRCIPMRESIYQAFKEQKKLNMILGRPRNVEIEGCHDFIFTAKTGRPLMPGAVNNILYNVVDAFNKAETEKAERERRTADLLPEISAHCLRHTGCTRMAESGMDIKVLQYIMGHANIAVTMEVYNHISDARVEKEIQKLERLDMAVGE